MNRASSPGKQLRWPLIDPPPLNFVARSYSSTIFVLNAASRSLETTPGMTKYPTSSRFRRRSRRTSSDNAFMTTSHHVLCHSRSGRQPFVDECGVACHARCGEVLFHPSPAVGSHPRATLWIPKEGKQVFAQPADVSGLRQE